MGIFLFLGGTIKSLIYEILNSAGSHFLIYIVN